MTIGDQMINSYKGGTMKMVFASTDSTNFFSPHNPNDNVLERVTHEWIHREVTFLSIHGEECSLKEEFDSLLCELCLYSLAGETKNPSFDQNTLSVDLLTN